MKRLSILMPIIVVLSLLASVMGWDGVVYAGNGDKIDSSASPDRMIIHFKSGVSQERMDQIYLEMGATAENNLPQINAHVMKMSAVKKAGHKSVGDFAEIESVEPDPVARVLEVPNDTDYSQQWGLAKIQAPQAWNLTHSANTIKIAILDSGIDSLHKDLASKVVVKQNFTDSPTTEDKYGHGTHVAGIAAAATNNSLGVAGVGYNTSLMNVKVLGDNGGGAYSWIIQGILWAADNGANVINLSIGANVDSASMKQAIDYAWSKGVVVVVAAGNSGNSNPSYPAYYDNCLAVGATDQNDARFSFSNYGSWVDVAAPGSTLSTTMGDSYGTMGGTSMASPFVAGLAGLAFAMARDTNGNGKRNDEIRTAIQNGCDNIGVPGIGNGRINAYKTLNSLYIPPSEPSQPPPPPPAPPPTPAPTPVAPGVQSGAASNISFNSATLNGSLTSLGSTTPVKVSFDYGTSTGYGSTTAPQSMTAPGHFSTGISLAPSTTYHFRGKAVGSTTVYGVDQFFTTPAAPVNNTSKTFGLNSGNNVWSDSGNVLNAMRYQNTAGTGTLTKLELLINDSTPNGKVRLGVYADNAGKPGSRILDAGEVTVTNGWVAISGLNLPVNQNSYYWLAFDQQNSNGVAFLSSGANPINIPHYWVNGTAYGALPSSFNLTGSGYNVGPYVMRATVTASAVAPSPTPTPTPAPAPVNKTFGLSSGDNVWSDSGNVLNAMRYQNTAGTGTLTRLELLINDTTPNGKVRLGVYADNAGKPGSRLLDAGEVTVTNGWVAISGLNLPVSSNGYYWLAFNLQSTNGVTFLTSGANTSKSAHYWANGVAYGSLPASFNLTGSGSNLGPYVMRGTVSVNQP